MDIIHNVGNRFCPTETQLVTNYLVPKIAGNDHLVTCIPEFDPFQLEPWNLPQDLKITPNDLELYIFCPRFPNLGRPKRTMITGYWRGTGYASQVPPENSDGVTGTKKIFVFYKGKFPNGVNTKWVMHEYSVSITSPTTQKTFVLCKIMKRADKNANVSTEDEGATSGCHEENVADDPFPEEIDPQMLEDMKQFFATYSQ